MAFKPLFVSFVLTSLLIVNIKGNIDTKHTKHLGHQRINHLMKRSSLKIRESENNQVNCTELELFIIGEKYRRECNTSMLNMVYDDAEQYLYNGNRIPDDVLTTLNNEYSKFCIAKCIEPYLKYYQCHYTGEELTHSMIYLQSFSCGREKGDFCFVLYLRHYATIKNISGHVYQECTYADTIFHPINCSNPTPSCTNSISRLNENIGCCIQPWLGDLNACNIDSLNEPCNSAASSGDNNTITPAISNGSNNTITPAVSSESNNTITLAVVTISLIITLVGMNFFQFF